MEIIATIIADAVRNIVKKLYLEIKFSMSEVSSDCRPMEGRDSGHHKNKDDCQSQSSYCKILNTLEIVKRI